MKRFLILIYFLSSTIVYAHTINWYSYGRLIQTTTCDAGDNIVPPTPSKYGYHFSHWEALYTQIKYIQGSATTACYIDTKYSPKSTTRIRAKFQFGSTANDKSLVFGGSNGGFELYPWDHNLEFNYGGSNNFGASVQDNDIVELDWNQNIVNYTINSTYDHTLILPNKSFSGGNSLYIFTLHRAIRQNDMKLYYFQIYDNGTLVRDFIPVLDKEGVPCLIDRIEHKYYYNLGSCNFIAGPLINE